MLKDFANVPIAILVKNQQEDATFINQCNADNIHVYERDEEDIDDATNLYPLCYLINKTDFEYSVLWVDKKRLICDVKTPFVIIDFLSLVNVVNV